TASRIIPSSWSSRAPEHEGPLPREDDLRGSEGAPRLQGRIESSRRGEEPEDGRHPHTGRVRGRPQGELTMSWQKLTALLTLAFTLGLIMGGPVAKADFIGSILIGNGGSQYGPSLTYQSDQTKGLYDAGNGKLGILGNLIQSRGSVTPPVSSLGTLIGSDVA